MTQSKTTTYHAGTLYRQTGPDKSRNWLMRLRTAAGVRKSISTGTADEAEAQRILALTLGDVAAGRLLPARGRDAVTVEDGVDLIRHDYTIRGLKSFDDIARRIDLHVRPFFGGTTRLDTITAKRIRAFGTQRLREGSSNANLNRELDALRKMFTLAMKEEGNEYLRRPAFPRYSEAGRVRQGFFEDDQVAAIRRQLPDYWHPVLTFAHITGWRIIAEVLTLEWPQVDRSACVITLPDVKSKNGKGRVIVYRTNPDLVRVIDTQWKQRQGLARDGVITPLVFHHEGRPLYTRPRRKKGQPLPEAQIATGKPSMADFMRVAWRQAARAAGIPGRIPHDFRRTAVRAFSRKGVADAVGMAVSGHLTRAVYDNYNIVDEEDLANALAPVAASQPAAKGKRRR